VGLKGRVIRDSALFVDAPFDVYLIGLAAPKGFTLVAASRSSSDIDERVIANALGVKRTRQGILTPDAISDYLHRRCKV